MSTIEYQFTVPIGVSVPEALARILLIVGDLASDPTEDVYTRSTTIENDVATRKTISSDNTKTNYETKTLLATKRFAHSLRISRKELRDADVDPETRYSIVKKVLRHTIRPANLPFTIVLKEERTETLKRLVEIDLDGSQDSADVDQDVVNAGLNFIAQFHGGKSIASSAVYKLFTQHGGNKMVNVVPVRAFDPERAPHYYIMPKKDGLNVTVMLYGTAKTVEVYFSIPRVPGLFLYTTIDLPTDSEGNGAPFVPHAIFHAEMMEVPEPHFYIYDIVWANWRDERKQVEGKSLVPRKRGIAPILNIFMEQMASDIADETIYVAGDFQVRTHSFTLLRGNAALQMEEVYEEYLEAFVHNGESYIDGIIITPEDADLDTLRRSQRKRVAQPTTILKWKEPSKTTIDALLIDGALYMFNTNMKSLVEIPKYPEITVVVPDEAYEGCVCEMSIVKKGRYNYEMRFVRARPYKIAAPNTEITVRSNIREVLRPTSFADLFGLNLTRVSRYLRTIDGALTRQSHGDGPIIYIGAGNGGSRWQAPTNKHVLWMEPSKSRYEELVRRVSGRGAPKTWYTLNAGIDENLPIALERFKAENRAAYNIFFGGMRSNTILIYFVLTFIDPADYYKPDRTGFFDIIRDQLGAKTVSMLDFDRATFPRANWQALGARIVGLGGNRAQYRIPGIVTYQEGFVPDFAAAAGATELKRYKFKALEKAAISKRAVMSRSEMRDEEREYIDMIGAASFDF